MVFHLPVKRRKVPTFAFFFLSFFRTVTKEATKAISAFCGSAQKAGLSFLQAGVAWKPGALQVTLKPGRWRKQSRKSLG